MRKGRLVRLAGHHARRSPGRGGCRAARGSPRGRRRRASPGSARRAGPWRPARGGWRSRSCASSAPPRAGVEPQPHVFRPASRSGQAARGQAAARPRPPPSGTEMKLAVGEGLAQAAEEAPGLSDVLAAVLVELPHRLEGAAGTGRRARRTGGCCRDAREHGHAPAGAEDAADLGQHLAPVDVGEDEAHGDDVEAGGGGAGDEVLCPRVHEGEREALVVRRSRAAASIPSE